MEISCGTDIIEIDRIKKAIENIGDKFIANIFTDKEIEYCENRKLQKYQHYAARFAAKEATFKALNKYLRKGTYDWKTFEILKDKNGKPVIVLHADIENLECIDISMSHCKEYAMASVFALFKEAEK